MLKTMIMRMTFCMLLVVSCQVAVTQAQDGGIIHDAEYYILEAQNGNKWAAEDKDLDARLAQLKKKHGGPPNIVYILWDDTIVGASVVIEK